MSSKNVPIVAIVGRANVGKSSLFNSVLRRREAVVAMEPGTTRDSITAKASYNDHNFWLVDTAGLKSAEDEFELTIQEQITQATSSADLILVVVEATPVITEEDRRVATMALKSRKSVGLIVNKVDQAHGKNLDHFERLGIKPIIYTCASQNDGIETMLQFVTETLPKATITEDDDRIRLAILGRPNVGKSALFNALAKKQQAIVADRAGTTRDVNRAVVKYQKREIELLDTAGIRRSGKIEVGVEKFSVLRTLGAIEESDICLLVLDVNDLESKIDQKIGGLIKEAGKGLIIVVSKWDSFEKDAFTRDTLAARIRQEFEFVPWAPLIFTSSVEDQNITKIFELASEIAEVRTTKITTSRLNSWLEHQIHRHPPAGLKNRHPKLNYMTQITDEKTPTFKLFGAHTKLLHWSYKRFLEKELRNEFGFAGTAINMTYLEKHIDRKKADPFTWKSRLRTNQLPESKIRTKKVSK